VAGSVSEASASPDIIYYKNINTGPVSATRATAGGTLVISSNSIILSDISYNRITKMFLYTIKPGSILNYTVSIPVNATTRNKGSYIYTTANGWSTQNIDGLAQIKSETWYMDTGKITDGGGEAYIFSSSFDLGSTARDTSTVTKYVGSYNPPKDLWFDFTTRLYCPTNYDITAGLFLTFTPIENNPPTISLITPTGQTIINSEGLSSLNIEGYVNDPDGDDVAVEAEITNTFYKKTAISSAVGYKYFSLNMDALTDSIPPGNYTLTVRASDSSNLSASASIAVSVKERLRNKGFILLGSTVEVPTKYSDYESDPELERRYKYDHDPYFFENPIGLIADSGTWRSSPYTTFTKTGSYVASFQARDNPMNDARFDQYRNWGRNNLSGMTFMVHRKPNALFSVKNLNGAIEYVDYSYDTDHMSEPNKGLIDWQWQYKSADVSNWTDGKLSGSITGNYDVRLRVRDIDGESGVGVWSDWSVVLLGDRSANTPPVALFTAAPASVSYKGTVTITDQSFDPDNDPLIAYIWTVAKNGITIWSSGSMPPNLAGYGVGTYVVSLQVQDSKLAWSNLYTQTVVVINNPPAAAFTMPTPIYRDTVVSLQSLSANPDADGDYLSFQWNTKLNGGANHYAGSNETQNMTIRDIIARDGISQIDSISSKWQMQLTVSDGSQSSNAVQSFEVLNHSPVAAITGPTVAYQYDSRSYSSASYDEDSADQSSLKYFWKITDPEGGISMVTTPTTAITFAVAGTYRIEHWVVDQIGARSNIASLDVAVSINQPPTMTITSPTGEKDSPSVLLDDPNIIWTYSDPENDLQSQVKFEFFDKEDLLINTIQQADPSGTLRQYQVLHNTFERFEKFYFYGRSYSKYDWSNQSNVKAFIIDNPPVPGFTLMTDTGRNAAAVPIYRTDILQINGTATDADIPKGDSIKYQYFLKPSSGAEGLASAQESFTKQFTTNGTFTFRQVVTDTLGVYRELSQNITVVNRIPVVNITYPTSISPASPTIASTLTPVIKWDYQDEDGDEQQRFKVRIINLASGAVKTQSGEQVSGVKQWQVPSGTLAENEKYAVEVEVYDGFGWSSVSPRKYMMVNLLSIKGAVQHTEEWNSNRQAYNLNKSGNAESPRGYTVYWAGEKFVLQGTATGLPDTVEVTMTGGYIAQLSPTGSDKTKWTGELADSSFEQLPDGPVTFTFTATNEFHTKVDTVTVTIQGDWSEYYQNHRVK
jgi:hypothetical protein